MHLGSCALLVPTQALHLDTWRTQLSQGHMGRVKSMIKKVANLISISHKNSSILLVQLLKRQFRYQDPCPFVL